MEDEPPSLEDNIRQFLTKDKRHNSLRYHDYSLCVVAHCPPVRDEYQEEDEDQEKDEDQTENEDEGEDEDLHVEDGDESSSSSSSHEAEDLDFNVLLVKANPASSSSTTWRLPEIEPSELPGSTGINSSLRKLVMGYCNDILGAPDRFCKLLHSTKVTTPSDAQEAFHRDKRPILKIYVVVGYAETQELRNGQGENGFGLVSLKWLKQHEDDFAGDQQDFVSIKSAVNAYPVIHDVRDETYVPE